MGHPATLSAVVDEAEVPADEIASLRRIAARIVLPRRGAWMERGAWSVREADIGDMRDYVPAEPRRGVGRVELVQSAERMTELRRDLLSSEEVDWSHYIHSSTDHLAEPDGIRPEDFVLAIRRPRRRRWEGMLVARRSVWLSPGEHAPRLEYRLHPDFIYVDPAARGEMLAAALTAAAAVQIEHDVSAIAERIEGMEKRPEIVASVVGEAASDGGVRMFDELVSAMELSSEFAFAEPVSHYHDF